MYVRVCAEYLETSGCFFNNKFLGQLEFNFYKNIEKDHNFLQIFNLCVIHLYYNTSLLSSKLKFHNNKLYLKY